MPIQKERNGRLNLTAVAGIRFRLQDGFETGLKGKILIPISSNVQKIDAQTTAITRI